MSYAIRKERQYYRHRPPPQLCPLFLTWSALVGLLQNQEQKVFHKNTNNSGTISNTIGVLSTAIVD